MIKKQRALLLGILGFISVATNAQTNLYEVSSKEQGAPFDLVVTEIKREPYKSYIKIPNFGDRSAQGSRWLMCAYTDLTIKRGFTYWTVMYPKNHDDILLLGFSNTESTSPAQIFGKEYDSEASLDTSLYPIEPWKVFCGMND